MPAAWSLSKALRVAISRRKPLEKIRNKAALGEPLLDNNPNNSMTNRMSRPSNMDDNDKLTLIDLLAIGIGGTIGSGVFVLTGGERSCLEQTTIARTKPHKERSDDVSSHSSFHYFHH